MFLVPLTRHSTDLARSFDRLFDESLFGVPSRADAPATRSPALDVAETERTYTVRLDLPGVAKEDVKIAIEGRRITVEATTAQASEKKDGAWRLKVVKAIWSEWCNSGIKCMNRGMVHRPVPESTDTITDKRKINIQRLVTARDRAFAF